MLDSALKIPTYQMAIIKNLNQDEYLIDEFNSEFADYVLDPRDCRYLAAALRLGGSKEYGISSHFKIDVMKTLRFNEARQVAIKADFKRYYSSPKIAESCFNFIGNSKFEKTIYDAYIDSAINKGVFNNLPDSISSDSGTFSGLNLIFSEITFPAKEKIIFLYDAWIASQIWKEAELDRLKIYTNKLMQLTRSCKWFDDRPGGLEAAYDYLKANDPFCTYFSDSDDLKIYFFKKYENNPDTVELSIRKIQLLFNNRKSRASKATRQANFSLSDQSIRNIKKLSLKHEINRSKTIDDIFKNDELVRVIDDYLSRGRSQRFFGSGNLGD